MEVPQQAIYYNTSVGAGTTGGFGITNSQVHLEQPIYDAFAIIQMEVDLGQVVHLE